MFRLVDTRWNEALTRGLNAGSGLDLICPFVKAATARRLVEGQARSIRLITRFNLDDFHRGVSDVAALRLLLAHGAKVRGVRHLHAKVYLFGGKWVMGGSANLTESALFRNHEFGFESDEEGIVSSCRAYFDSLWTRIQHPNLTLEEIEGWERRLEDAAVNISGARPQIGLGDEGYDLGLAPPPAPVPLEIADAPQAFVKFFGQATDRWDRSAPILMDLRDSGAHWACTYPAGHRPRQVQTGAVMYMGRLVKDPDDIIVYGRAIAVKHEERRDDASPEDIALRKWKPKWPHYIRVHHPVFVAGTLKNGVKLSELMDSLGSLSFETTQEHARAGQGNTNPRLAFRRQPAVRLSSKGHRWLSERFEQALEDHGTLSPNEMAGLDWPRLDIHALTQPGK